MKKVIFSFIITFILPFALFAQDNKAAFNQACNIFTEATKAEKTFHMTYDITITGNANSPGVNVKHNDVYKAPNAYKIIIGDEQEILYTPGRMMVINKTLNYIHYSEDTSTTVNTISNTLFSAFINLADNAVSIDKDIVNGNIVYKLNFGANYAYEYAKFTFNSQGIPSKIYCKFNQNQENNSFYEMSIDYTKWEYTFPIENGFPNIDKYIVKEGSEYKLLPEKAQYKLFQ